MKEKIKTKKEKEEALNATVECLHRVLPAIQEIKEGVLEAVVCRKYDINPSAFRYTVFNQSLGYKGVKPVDPDEFLLSPEERLYCDVFEIQTPIKKEIPLGIFFEIFFYWRNSTKRA